MFSQVIPQNVKLVKYITKEKIGEMCSEVKTFGEKSSLSSLGDSQAH